MATYVSEEEVVYDPLTAKTREEQEKIMKHNERAKTLRAERRQQERFETPTIFEKFAKGIKKLFGLVKAKETQHQQQNQQNSR